MALTVLPAFALGALAPFILEDVVAGTEVIGQSYALFFAMAGVSAPVFGRAVDRGFVRPPGRPLLIVAVASAALIASTASQWQLFAGAALGGLAYGGGNPVTNVSLAGLDPSRRGLGLGVKAAGVPAASMLSGLLVPLLAVTAGWRVAMMAVAALAAMAAALLRKPGHARERFDARASAAPIARDQWWARLHLTAYAFLLSFTTSCFNTYLVLYLVEVVTVTASAAGGAVALGGVFGIAGRILLAKGSDRLTDSAMYALLALLAVGGSVGASLLLVEGRIGVLLIPVVVFLYGLCLFGWGGVLAVALVRATPGQTGQTTGIVYAGFYAGLAVGPVVFGSLVVPHWGFGAGWLLCGAAGLFAAGSASSARHRLPST